MMTPAEKREKIQGYALMGKSCIDLREQYEKEKDRSTIAQNLARRISKKIQEMMDNGEYFVYIKPSEKMKEYLLKRNPTVDFSSDYSSSLNSSFFSYPLLSSQN